MSRQILLQTLRECGTFRTSGADARSERWNHYGKENSEQDGGKGCGERRGQEGCGEEITSEEAGEQASDENRRSEEASGERGEG